MKVAESLELAQAVAARVELGRLTREAAEVLLHERLPAACPSCQQTYREALALLFGPRPGAPRVIQRWPGPATQPETSLSREPSGKPTGRRRRSPADDAERQRRAESALGSLRAMKSWAVRRERVAVQWFHYRGTELGRLLLAEARDALPGDPEASDRWADLAALALNSSREAAYPDPESRTIESLRARLFRANAERCRGELYAAEQDFGLALQAAEDLQLRDLAFWAEAKSFLASLRRDQRNFPAATRAARAGAALYHAAGYVREEAVTHWQLATIREQAGDYEAALFTIRQALPGALNLALPRLEVDLRHFEAWTLARLSRFEEASLIQFSLRHLYDRHPDKELLRQWLRGLVAAGLGEPSEAEECFRFARDGFVAKKAAYDAALVTLDWTIVLLDAGRPADVVPLAVSMGQAFEGIGVGRETLASWSLLTEAAQRLELERAEAAAWVEVLDFERVVERGR